MTTTRLPFGCMCILLFNVLAIESRPPLRPLTILPGLNDAKRTSPFRVNEQSTGASGVFKKEATEDELELLEPEMMLILDKNNNNTQKFYMTKLAKAKTIRLAKKVSRYWEGKYFLVIISAFISNKDPRKFEHHKEKSLHFEGRAVDITIGTKNENGNTITLMNDEEEGRMEESEKIKKLKELATLARTGPKHFQFAKVCDNHVHVSTLPHKLLSY